MRSKNPASASTGSGSSNGPTSSPRGGLTRRCLPASLLHDCNSRRRPGNRGRYTHMTSPNERTYTERDAVSRIRFHERVLPAGRGGAPRWRQNE